MRIGVGCHSDRGRGHRHRFRGGAEEPGTLAALRPGATAVIGSIACATARAQAVRFGIGEGAVVSCITTVHAGPVILRSGRQEIAVGRRLARQIRVSGQGA